MRRAGIRPQVGYIIAMSTPLAVSQNANTPVRWDVTTVTDIVCACSQQTLFNYVTTPALWHTWHPATAKVTQVSNRPLTTGETMHERIHTPLQDFDAVWTVDDCVPHERWVIVTSTPQGNARITYDIVSKGDACHFTRTLQYTIGARNWRSRLGPLVAFMLKRQSRTALRNLQRVVAGR